MMMKYYFTIIFLNTQFSQFSQFSQYSFTLLLLGKLFAHTIFIFLMRQHYATKQLNIYYQN